MLRLNTLLLGGWLAAGAAAQPAQIDNPFSRAHGVWREGAMVAGAGPGYLVELRPGAFTYVPALPDAKSTRRVEFAFRAIRRGSEVVVRNGGEAARIESATAAVYRRHGVIERYDLSADGVEQSFVLEEPPRGCGDVEVIVEISAPGRPDRTGDVSSGFSWRVDPAGAVRVGRAHAVDAAGRRTEMAMHLEHGTLRLVLPGSAADHARYPLVLDPPIDTVFVMSPTGQYQMPDVAYNNVADQYLGVWVHRVAHDNSFILAGLWNGDGTFGRIFPVAFASGTTVRLEPTVGAAGRLPRFCVAWQTGPSMFGPWSVDVVAVDAQTGTVSSVAPLSSITIAEAAAPDLGSSGTSNRMPLVYDFVRGGIGVTGIALSGTGPPILTGLAPFGSAGATNPAVSAGSGSRTSLVVWEEGDTAIHAAPVDDTGVVLATPFVVEGGNGARVAPDVDGDGRDFVVVFQREEAAGSAVHDVVCRSLRWDGSALTATTPVTAIDADPNQDEISPAVGWFGSLALLAWSEEQVGFLDYDLILQTFDPQCTPCGQRHVARRSASLYDTNAEIATQASGGGSSDGALVVFAGLDNTTFESTVQGQLFEAFGGGAEQNAGSGCGLGGTISLVGPFALGNLNVRFDLTGADPTATSAVFLLGSPGPTIPCQSCQITNPVVHAPVGIVNGSASIPVPVPCHLSLALGATIETQFLTVGTSVSPCSLAPTLSATNRLQVTLDY